MTNQKVIDFTSKIFNALHLAKKIDDLKNIIHTNNELAKNAKRSEKYPEWKLSISAQEITSNGLHTIFEKTDANFFDQFNTELTPLEKLLLATTWKQGDLQKVNHIIDGILDRNEAGNTGHTFRQFGRFIRDQDQEPLIDQHVLRAFSLYEFSLKPQSSDNAQNSEIDKIRANKLISAKHNDIIVRYKNWLNSSLSPELRKEKDYKKAVDDVLFALGKSIKAEPLQLIYQTQ